MKNNKLTIIINKPIAEVFAFCITPPKAKLWVPGIVNEKTNEWPAKIGTVYTEYKNNKTSFNIIVTDYKENEYIEWKTEDNNYHVRYTFTPIDQNTTQLVCVETGDVEKPFTQEVLEKLKEVIEKVKMKQSLLYVALVVRDYDEAIDFFTKKLHFVLVEDTHLPEEKKRWVLIAPPGSTETKILLALPSNEEQKQFIGNQTGGRVTFFLNTDDFWRDYREMVERGITFVREPKEANYGIVAVWEDLYGNWWDLLQLKHK